MLASIALLAPFVLPALTHGGTNCRFPGDTVPPGGQPDPIDLARAENQRVFDTTYLELKEPLFAKHAGKWLAIAGGELLPANSRGGIIPAQEIGSVLELLDERHPDALHRFIFRIGEEGDVRYHATLCERPGYVGRQFLRALDGNVWITPAGVLLAELGSGTDTGAQLIGPSGGGALHAEVATPDGEFRPMDLWVANVYGGTATFRSATARGLGLQRWEIPGEVRTYFQSKSSEVPVTPLGPSAPATPRKPGMLRARIKARTEYGGLDRWMPVAVARR